MRVVCAKCERRRSILRQSKHFVQALENTIKNSLAYAKAVSEAAGLPLVANCCKAEYCEGIEKAYPVEVYVKKLWEEFED